MAQAGYSSISLYYTTTLGAAPVAGNLVPGELGFNINNSDFALYAENASGTVTRLMNNPAGLKYPTADGTAGQALLSNGAGVLSFGTVSGTLPSQAGNAGKYLTTDGTNPSWATGTGSGLVYLGAVTPSAAANLDFLNGFSASYDNYVIICDGLGVAADDSLILRLATGGSADSGSNYYSVSQAVSLPTTSAATSVPVSSTVTSAGRGVTVQIEIKNVNDATKLKTIHSRALSQSAATPAFTSLYTDSAYIAANTVSGFRLSLSGGSNFAATGSIRIYGYVNS